MKKELNKKQREFCCGGKGNKKSANKNAKTVLADAASASLYGTKAANKKTNDPLVVMALGLVGLKGIQAKNE